MYYITVSSFLQMVDEIFFAKLFQYTTLKKKAVRLAFRTAFFLECDRWYYASVTACEIAPLEIIQP